jgi:ABC-type uncharacterized transport system involved in gliding motility auxiliary subunit
MLSKQGKILFFFSALAFVVLGVCRLVYGGWTNAFWLPLGLTLVFFAAGVAKDWRGLRELFGMRSTKHGMNMGALILTAIVGLVCVNYLADRYDVRADWTKEKLNSLSDQSIKAAQALKAPTELMLLYGYKTQGAADEAANNPDQIQKQIKIIAEMYRNVGPQITFTAYNALTRPDLAQKYEYSFGPFAFFAIQGERKVRIDPATEEAITRSLLKLERDKKKIIYFTRGHGEHSLDQKDERGLSKLREDLEVTYELRSFALFETKNTVPEDASALAIIGPNQQFLDEELKAVREYVTRGGHLLVAIDPGTKQNLAGLVKSVGIEFTNDYVFDNRSRVLNAAPQLVLGTTFSQGSEITRGIKQDAQSFALFDLASSLKKAPDAPATITVEPLISSDEHTGSVTELKKGMVIQENGPHIIAMTSKGRMPTPLPDKPLAAPGVAEKPESKDFTAVVFGDSDFIANRLIQNNLNRDIVENAFAWLASDTDLISIRPKEPKGTKLRMMNTDFVALILILFLVSVALFGTSIGFWWRRRTA